MRNCPSQTQKGGFQGHCHNCGVWGHAAAQCPKNVNEVDDQKETARRRIQILSKSRGEASTLSRVIGSKSLAVNSEMRSLPAQRVTPKQSKRNARKRASKHED